ncbi:unnamed protein product [Diamesa serratosioi]
MDEPRDTAILTAVNFLNNPKVSNSTLLQKRNFLKTKGLTDREIQVAFEKVGVFVKMSENQETRINMSAVSNLGRNYNHQSTRFEKIKDIISSTALIGAIAYAIYMFYKKYIRPYLFGRKDAADKLEEVSKVTVVINTELIKIREDINTQKQMNETNAKMMSKSMENCKNEIETIKGILLNRKSFASPPTIPSWQLNAAKQAVNSCDNKSDSSGNSEENEVGLTKRSQNSDSSLEIM